MKVYQAINKVQSALSIEGIGKDRKNEQQGYKFRGIDDVYNALAPLLAKHGLCILPRVTSRDVVERVNAKGTALFYVTVAAEFDFVCAEDGSKHTVVTYGEAMDSGDKATNKAMSAAYKYACMQAFSIPTEGDNDADATTHEVAAKAPQDPFAPFTTNEKKVIRATAEEAITAFGEGKEWFAFEQVESAVSKIGAGDADKRNQVMLAIAKLLEHQSALRAYLKEQFRKQAQEAKETA